MSYVTFVSVSRVAASLTVVSTVAGRWPARVFGSVRAGPPAVTIVAGAGSSL